jgi:hypothetical protein
MRTGFEEAAAIEEKVCDLCGRMTEETKRCRKLIEISRAEQDFLMKNDIDNLSMNTDKMKEVVEGLKKSQVARHELMKEIGRDLGIVSGKLSISRIEKAVDPALAERLREISKDLLKTGERLYRLNHNTIYLIDFSLDLLNQQSQLWAQLLSEEEGYQEEGKRASQTPVPLLVEEKV